MAFQIAESQAFLDGNKRTALDLALTFLSMNGFELNSKDDLRLYDALVDIAEKKVSREDFAKLLKTLCHAAPASDPHDHVLHPELTSSLLPRSPSSVSGESLQISNRIRETQRKVFEKLAK